ncbi:winged helix-turn-helix transcriptional regulator [Mollicutes bacterium LVI A0078]|nr:winged helix-turn-helix transcriptional regulator [Mollicutes bacterium LVI A0075]WOO90709.1 winged helix-turn-helix transcriptional regulator [Mollicutes bacterium LVI A0078]
MEKCNVMDCDVYHAIKIIKSRYASVFIFSLAEDSKTFGEIEAEFDFISSVQVSRTLKELRLYKIANNNDGKYSLTEAGQALVPILDSLEEWNEKYNS